MVSIALRESLQKVDVLGKVGGETSGRYQYTSHLLPTKISDKQLGRTLMLRLTRPSKKLVDRVPAEFDTRRTEEKTSRRQKTVNFNHDFNDTRLFDVDGVPPMELWWSSDELQTSRCDGKLCATVDPTAQAYCRAYERASRQVHTDRKLTVANLTELVKGLDLGHRGLEHYSACDKRKSRIREHVVSVIKCYRDASWLTFTGMDLDTSSHASVSSGRSGRSATTASTAKVTSTRSLDRTVRSHSSKLSAGNRHFAAAVGKADHLAAHAAEGY